MAKVSESYKSQLKLKAGSFLPPEMNSVETQRNVLFMVETVAPVVSVCRKNAEEQLWPKVKSGEMSMQDARKKCAVYLNKLAGITIVENLKLERHSRENLQKAWIAMDSYAQMLKAEESPKLRSLMDEVAAVIEQKETGRKPSAAAEMKTVPVDTKKSSIPEMKTVEPGASVSNNSHSSQSSQLQEYTTSEQKRRGNPLAVVIALVLVVAIAAVAIGVAWKQVQINNVEEAISEIGTVTVESSGAIKDAELAFGQLSEEQQAKVENYEVLIAARAELDRLENLIREAVAAIEDIGTVTLNSGAKIQKARKAYDALEADNLTGYVTEEAEVLVAAEAGYERLYGEKLFTDGQALFEKESYAAALKKFDELVKNYPTHSRVNSAKSYAAKCVVFQAQESFNKGEYETTMNLLTEGKKSYGDSTENKDLMDKLIKRLDSIRPINGKKFKDTVGWGYGKLNVTAGTKDVVVKIVSEADPQEYMMFYVRAGESYEVSVKDGDYKVLFGTGDHWYGEKDGFGKAGTYKEVNKRFSFTTVREGSYIYYNARKLNLASTVDAVILTFDKFSNYI